MQTNNFVEEIDAEIRRLTEVRNLLAGARETARPGRPKATAKKKRTLSKEARERIAAAQRKRWAAQKKAAKA